MSQESFGSGSSLAVRRSAPFSGALRSDEALDWRDATERVCTAAEGAEGHSEDREGPFWRQQQLPQCHPVRLHESECG